MLPELFGSAVLHDDGTATEWLNQYLDLLETLHAISETSTPAADAAEAFLESLADYGNYYDLVVELVKNHSTTTTAPALLALYTSSVIRQLRRSAPLS